MLEEQKKESMVQIFSRMFGFDSCFLMVFVSKRSFGTGKCSPGAIIYTIFNTLDIANILTFTIPTLNQHTFYGILMPVNFNFITKRNHKKKCGNRKTFTVAQILKKF